MAVHHKSPLFRVLRECFTANQWPVQSLQLLPGLTYRDGTSRHQADYLPTGRSIFSEAAVSFFNVQAVTACSCGRWFSLVDEFIYKTQDSSESGVECILVDWDCYVPIWGCLLRLPQ